MMKKRLKKLCNVLFIKQKESKLDFLMIFCLFDRRKPFGEIKPQTIQECLHKTMKLGEKYEADLQSLLFLHNGRFFVLHKKNDRFFFLFVILCFSIICFF